MYEAFYKIKRRPFLTIPDPDALYWSEAHTMAFTILRYAVMTKAPLALITGEIGSGKTTLLRQLLREAPGDVVVGLVSNMNPGRGELLQWVMMALDQPVGDDNYIELFRRFQSYTIDVYARGGRVVLVFDEAQNLDAATLEELRMLSNINSDDNEVLQIILVGQPQLREIVGRPELNQFAQRICADFHLHALSAPEVEAYINHRLEIAGAGWRIFPSSSCRVIHEATRGVPRLINVLCDLCMVYGYAADAPVIEESLVHEFLAGARRHGIYEQFHPVANIANARRAV